MLQPPTDNLYKFLSIFGLIVMMFGVYIPLQKLEPLERNNMQRSIMYKPIMEKSKVLAEFARTDLDCAIYEASEDIVNDNASIENPCIRRGDEKTEVITVKKNLEVIVEKITSLEAEHIFLLNQYRFYRAFGVTSGLIGFLLCVAGFWLWYVRLQRYLDIVSRENALHALGSKKRKLK